LSDEFACVKRAGLTRETKSHSAENKLDYTDENNICAEIYKKRDLRCKKIQQNRRKHVTLCYRLYQRLSNTRISAELIGRECRLTGMVAY